ncbi:hypothetical protein JCM17846_25030 [Iodidimonas nitroreducens]|uniref:Uncharacterized protein n=1 Tax=Iodidimonas nitroreducens TaxID=1236968 RepID=A0A5A7N912_9PROT|nr:hypothetical protein JCM17846_25030 [Iodidimonas nitroreducens]
MLLLAQAATKQTASKASALIIMPVPLHQSGSFYVPLAGLSQNGYAFYITYGFHSVNIVQNVSEQENPDLIQIA